VFSPEDNFSYRNISIGDHVYIGPGANFSAITSLEIGNHVMFGPRVIIVGGDHNTSVVGKMMAEINWKIPENDRPIRIEDDVWVGAGVVILKGVTLHTGCVVAAGAVVTCDVPEYAVAAGVPARVVKMRFDDAKLQQHKKILSIKNR